MIKALQKITSYRSKLEYFKLPKWLGNDSPKVFGRWQLEYCDQKLNHKVDWANVDHCGPCGIKTEKTVSNELGNEKVKNRILWKQETLRNV